MGKVKNLPETCHQNLFLSFSSAVSNWTEKNLLEKKPYLLFFLNNPEIFFSRIFDFLKLPVEVDASFRVASVGSFLATISLLSNSILRCVGHTKQGSEPRRDAVRPKIKKSQQSIGDKTQKSKSLVKVINMRPKQTKKRPSLVCSHIALCCHVQSRIAYSPTLWTH